MFRVKTLEKVVFWVLYVFPYFSFIILWLIATEFLAGLNSEMTQSQSSNIFSNFYDTLMLLLYGVGLLGIYTWLYDKEYLLNDEKYFSKKFWLFIFIILVVDIIGKILYNLDNFFIRIIVQMYFIYYFLTLFLLIRSYHE